MFRKIGSAFVLRRGEGDTSFGSSSHLKTETSPASEMLYFLVNCLFRTIDKIYKRTHSEYTIDRTHYIIHILCRLVILCLVCGARLRIYSGSQESRF
jgi:hypothetical protein